MQIPGPCPRPSESELLEAPRNLHLADTTVGSYSPVNENTCSSLSFVASRELSGIGSLSFSQSAGSNVRCSPCPPSPKESRMGSPGKQLPGLVRAGQPQPGVCRVGSPFKRGLPVEGNRWLTSENKVLRQLSEGLLPSY